MTDDRRPGPVPDRDGTDPGPSGRRADAAPAAAPDGRDAAVRAYLLGRDVVPDPFTLDTSRRNRLGGALRAAAAGGGLPQGLADEALDVAVASVSGGVAGPEDVWWAAGNGWLRSGARQAPHDLHVRDAHPWLRGPTPVDALARHLAALVALRPLFGTRRPHICRCGTYDHGEHASRMALRAVDGFGDAAGPCVSCRVQWRL